MVNGKYRVLGLETQVVSDKQLGCSTETMGHIVPSGGEILSGCVGPHWSGYSSLVVCAKD